MRARVGDASTTVRIDLWIKEAAETAIGAPAEMSSIVSIMAQSRERVILVTSMVVTLKYTYNQKHFSDATKVLNMHPVFTSAGL
jgi:hypothetical protein